VAVARQAVVDHLARRDVKRCEQGGGAVPLVIMSHRAGASLLERQARLGTIESLDLALLVHREDDRPLGRIEIEADDVAELLHESGIVGELEGIDPMRLETVRMPDTHDRHLANPEFGGHETRAQMSRHLAGGLGLQGSADDLRFDKVGIQPLGAARARQVTLDSRDSALIVAVQPAAHRGGRHAHLITDLLAGEAVRGGQDDLRPLNDTQRSGTRANEPIERVPIPVAQLGNASRIWHEAQYSTSSRNMHETSVTLH
jgi:hypothetical protein